MSKKEAFVFGLLALGIASAFGGIALVTRDAREGWIGILIAIPMLLLASRSMRVVGSATDVVEIVKRED